MFTRRQFIRASVATGAAGVAAVAFAACAPAASSPSTSAQQTAPAQQAAALRPAANTTATLTAGIGSDVGSMDPQSLAGTGGGNWPNYETHFPTPLTVDPDTSEVKSYAVDWQWERPSADAPPAALLLKVKPGITFHNGEPLDAAQLQFNFDRALGRAAYNTQFQSGIKGNFASVGSTEVVDPTTLRVEMTHPDVTLPSQVAATLYLVPKDYMSKVGDTEFAANPVGWGPFKFASRTPDSELHSTRNDAYFYPRDGQYAPRLPYIANLVQKVIPQDNDRVAALERGEIDLAHNVSSDLAKSFSGRSGFKVFYLQGDQPMYIRPDTTIERDPDTSQPNPWLDLRVRKASNMAVDLDTIIKTILTGKEQPTFGSALHSYGFPEDLKQQRFAYDPQQAKQLLADAGYPNGFQTNLFYPIGRWPNTEQVVQAVAGYLGAVGIQSKIVSQQYQVTTTNVKSHKNYGLTFFGMAGGADPGPNFRYNYTQTGAYTFSFDPALQIDSLVEQSESAFDPAKRKDLLGEIIKRFYLDALCIFLYEPVTVVIARDNLQWDIYGHVVANPQYWRIQVP
jgi:peptide/nickel transport system substrate-binding protein